MALATRPKSSRGTSAQAPRRTPKQNRARERVERILDAATALLSQVPVEAVTTSRIAERARVPIGSVYQYFPNRLAILAAVTRRVMGAVDVRTLRQLEASDGETWGETLDRAIDATLKAYREVPGYVGVLRAIRTTPEFHSITEESNTRVVDLLVDYAASRKTGLSAKRLRTIAETAIAAGNALQDRVLAAESPSEATAAVREMKTLLRAYLATYFEAGNPSATQINGSR